MSVQVKVIVEAVVTLGFISFRVHLNTMSDINVKLASSLEFA